MVDFFIKNKLKQKLFYILSKVVYTTDSFLLLWLSW